MTHSWWSLLCDSVLTKLMCASQSPRRRLHTSPAHEATAQCCRPSSCPARGALLLLLLPNVAPVHATTDVLTASVLLPHQSCDLSASATAPIVRALTQLAEVASSTSIRNACTRTVRAAAQSSADGSGKGKKGRKGGKGKKSSSKQRKRQRERDAAEAATKPATAAPSPAAINGASTPAKSVASTPHGSDKKQRKSAKKSSKSTSKSKSKKRARTSSKS